MRAILDTSVLIGAEIPDGIEGATSVASIAELYFGVLVASEDGERARRTQRLGLIESTFDPLPVDAAVAREWGRLAAAVSARGVQPRRRAVDLAIAATANVQAVPVVTRDAGDFESLRDLVDVRVIADGPSYGRR